MSAPKILVVNGPNLNLLGTREVGVYGTDTLADIEEKIGAYVRELGIDVEFFQSNSEGALIDAIQNAAGTCDGVVYNPGAHAHYSYALRDAVKSVDVPVVEVHLTDISEREEFRRKSVIAPACVALVKGLGADGYCRAVDVFRENDKLVRLDEGYEKRYDLTQNTIVGIPQQKAKGGDTAPIGNVASMASAVVSASLEPAAPASSESAGLEPAFAEDVNRKPADPADPDLADADSAEDPGLTSSKRIALIEGACDQLGLDALLVRDTSSITWASAFDGVFDEERAHALLVSPGDCGLHTDSRYSNALRTAAREIGSAIAIHDERITHADFAAQLLATGEAPFAGALGMEDSITYGEYVRTASVFGADHLVPTHDVVLGLRAVKDEGEIARLKAAQAITDAAFSYIIGFIKPGMTEREVQLELENFMLRHGAEDVAFRSIVATGENGADPHAVPGATKLEAGQCVVMDFGAKLRGYCSDMTRMVFLGEPDAKKADAYRVLRHANETVEAALAPDMTGKEAHELAERLLAEGGYAGKMGHGLGHGVGIEVHELPLLNARYDTPLAPGNVVTVEPGIYLPGEFGMRLEDFGVITKTGYEVFTQSTHEMVVL